MNKQETYESQVAARLHSSLPGLKEGEGLAWLSNALRRLDATGEPGLREIVRSFLGLMNREGEAKGFLLEVRVADSLLEMTAGGGVSGNRQDGVATTTCDVTLEHDGIRADIQCKAVLNVANEMHVGELETWLNRQCPNLLPGLMVEIKPNKDADDQTLTELKNHLRDRLPSGLAGQTINFVDSREMGQVILTFEQWDEPGVHVGMVWSSADRIGVAPKVDFDEYRAVIRKRCKLARASFGFSPSETQFNFVAMTTPSLAFMTGYEFPYALYGQKVLQVGPNGCGWAFDASGLYHQEGVEHISGLIEVKFNGYAYDNVIYPHPSHEAAIRSFWEGRQGFRVETTPTID